MSNIIKFETAQDKIVQLRGQDVILDFAVAELYGVETREINQAVKNNPKKFPEGYILELSNDETKYLRSKLLMLEKTSGKGKYSKYNYRAFTEKGLYMLATILKGDKATETTLAIIEAFAKLRELSRTIREMTKNPNEYQQKTLMQRSGEIVDNLFGEDLQMSPLRIIMYTELQFHATKIIQFIHNTKEIRPFISLDS